MNAPSAGHRLSADEPAPIHVLHVDDDGDLADLTGTFLERESDRIRVQTASDTSEGLARLSESEIDCVVSDYDMPGRNGVEFLEAVRDDYPDLPFVLFTGKGSEEVASEAISAGVTDYLQKEAGTDQYAILANRVENLADQYRSQRALEASQERLSLFIDQSPLGVIEWNADFELVELNPAAEEILGYDTDEVRGDGWTKFVPDTAVDEVTDVMGELQEDAGGYHNVNENVTRDGETIYCEWYNRVVTDDDDEVVAVFSQFQDVTDRRAHEHAVAELHDVAVDLEAAETVDEICRRTIEAAQEVLQFEQGVMAIEEDGELVIHAESRELPPDATRTMSVDEGIAGKTYRTGESFLFDDVQSNPVADPKGPFRAAISVPVGDHGNLQVVSEKRGAFDERDLELAELLANRSASALDRLERTSALESQNERLERFARFVSHDLQSPLTVANGQLELAREECDSDRLSSVATAHDRIEALIDDLVTLARTGERISDPEPTDLAATARAALTTVDTADATVTVETDQTLYGDPHGLRRLLENLLGNAVEHGGDDVAVTVGDLPDGFFVADDGDGVPEVDRERVFTRGYSSTTNGSGLGLFIVQRIAQVHGWSATLTESEAGGARVEIRGVDVVDE